MLCLRFFCFWPLTQLLTILVFISCLWFRDDNKEYAIKKFKPDKEGEAATYIGISQSACREIAVGSVTFALDYVMGWICRN